MALVGTRAIVAQVRTSIPFILLHTQDDGPLVVAGRLRPLLAAFESSSANRERSVERSTEEIRTSLLAQRKRTGSQKVAGSVRFVLITVGKEVRQSSSRFPSAAE